MVKIYPMAKKVLPLESHGAQTKRLYLKKRLIKKQILLFPVCKKLGATLR